MIYGDTLPQHIRKKIKNTLDKFYDKLEAPIMMALTLEKFTIMNEKEFKNEYARDKKDLKKFKSSWNKKSISDNYYRYVDGVRYDFDIRAIKCRWTRRFYFIEVDKKTEPLLVQIYNSVYHIPKWF